MDSIVKFVIRGGLPVSTGQLKLAHPCKIERASVRYSRIHHGLYLE
jgi:hypothetical protein